MRFRPLVLLSAIIVLATACLPSGAATGRLTPVRKVEVIGDSLTWGLFGTTPTVESALRSKLAASGISLTLDGGAGDTLDTPWPGRQRWDTLLQARIDRDDPDVVIIQSILFPGANDPANYPAYRAAASRLIEIAQSRGAHVYLVAHHRPTDATELQAADIAEKLQAEAAAGHGVPTIPLNWWLDHCRSPFSNDGWHLSGEGEVCWANAANAAVNQLRNAVG
ncbi:MAG: SGNH/GDSL hydrolase family protein [Acidimicrobiales bacterium]